jgi:hypothetical protein
MPRGRPLAGRETAGLGSALAKAPLPGRADHPARVRGLARDFHVPAEIRIRSFA